MCLPCGKHFISSGLIRDKHKAPFLPTESSGFCRSQTSKWAIIRLCSSFMSNSLHKEIESMRRLIEFRCEKDWSGEGTQRKRVCCLLCYCCLATSCRSYCITFQRCVLKLLRKEPPSVTSTHTCGVRLMQSCVSLFFEKCILDTDAYVWIKCSLVQIELFNIDASLSVLISWYRIL